MAEKGSQWLKSAYKIFFDPLTAKRKTGPDDPAVSCVKISTMPLFSPWKRRFNSEPVSPVYFDINLTVLIPSLL